MNLFTFRLAKLEKCLMKNLKDTKIAFPIETQLIESGLALMWNLNHVTQEAIKDFGIKPNLYTNTNLFGRNRHLLLNGYFSMLCANYGTHFVISRTVLENNNLMRLFNKNPQLVFRWLPKRQSKKFPSEIREKYNEYYKSKRTTKSKDEFSPSWVIKNVFSTIDKKDVKKQLSRIYGQLCNYTHPNFLGWQELMGMQGKTEILLDLPTLVGANADEAIRMTLYLTQLSLKTFVETFRDYLNKHLFETFELNEWQENCMKIMVKYVV
jgi:hypothetical protein